MQEPGRAEGDKFLDPAIDQRGGQAKAAALS